MYERKIPETFDCGMSVAIKVIGGKWKAWILDCLNRDIKRPSALHREIQEISLRVINMHLRELEAYGIIYKEVYAEVPARVEYSLTRVGQSILPIMDAMDQWGSDNRAYVLGSRHQIVYDTRRQV
ncbi:winged helix-turn-helix transcriptional regulator [Dyadobacter sp. MSC1_007]|jgi:DNA-binding HxlR family transcriptional regulator|uniref:winged helix-turn-helix transcriptional regulator n=1 Tax=Dyadobacter sp. MSC1_007 TaxID=2909264 RepID=UPI002030112E|nr:helix-turn-helix domain-containing protein [Dyadobacter sp. MSC1_007]